MFAAGALIIYGDGRFWAPGALAAAGVGAALVLSVGYLSKRLLLNRLTEMEVAQRESQERLQDFTDAASDWLWEMDAELRYTYASRRFYEISGLREEQFMGRRHDLLDESDAVTSEWREHRANLEARRPFRDFTYGEPHPDGDRRWFRLSGRPKFTDNGTFEGYRGTGTDITAEVRAREEAVESTVRFLDAIESVSDGIAFWDEDDRFVLCNGRYRDLAGNAAHLLVRGTRYEDYMRGILEHAQLPVPEDEHDEWIERRTAEHRNPPNAVEVRRDGKWLLIRDERSPDGSIVSVATDISVVKQREQELEQIIDTVPMLLGYIDEDLCYERINRTFEEWFDISREEIRGWKVVDVHGARFFNFLKPYMELALAGREMRFEASIPYAAESTGKVPGYRGNRQIEVIYTPDAGADGAVEGFFVAANDVTERMLASAQLHQSQKMEAIGQLTGGVAHDFNNLLAVIVGSLDLLEGRIEGERPLKLLDSALRAARRGGELTQRLLAFGRRQALITEITDVNELVAGMTELFRRTLGVSIAIETDLAADPWLMDVDRGQLENALLNLSINARDAMPEGGRLRIETQNTTLDEAFTEQFEDLEPGKYVMIAVSDTGAGMPPEVRERAVEPFFSTKDTGQGSGLGLSMIYGFTKQSGGHMGIYSEPGEGTTVRLYLPAENASAKGAERGLGLASNLPSRGERILVLEDDPDVRVTTVSMLEELGYAVIEAETGEGALDLVDTGEPFDLLFSDVFLPDGMNGPEAARQILMRRPGLPVLFTSGYSADQITRSDMFEDGVQMISKPFEMAELARKIRECLGDGLDKRTAP